MDFGLLDSQGSGPGGGTRRDAGPGMARGDPPEPRPSPPGPGCPSWPSSPRRSRRAPRRRLCGGSLPPSSGSVGNSWRLTRSCPDQPLPVPPSIPQCGAQPLLKSRWSKHRGRAGARSRRQKGPGRAGGTVWSDPTPPKMQAKGPQVLGAGVRAWPAPEELQVPFPGG